jgi:hypothetical protein
MALPKKAKMTWKGCQKLFKTGGQGKYFFGKGQSEKHEDEGNGSEKGTQDLDFIFETSDQEDADDHPCKEGEGFIEVGHRRIAGFDIPREEGQGMEGESNGYDGDRYFREGVFQKNDI